MNYEEWEGSVPHPVKRDPTWKVQAYRLALYLASMTWTDAKRFEDDRRSALSAGQLCRACGSIGANIVEGYGRRSTVDRARYFEYALGSASEVRTWYVACRAVLSPDVLDERLAVLTSITRLLLVMIRTERTRSGVRATSRSARRDDDV
jgi:four helix bundle protein